MFTFREESPVTRESPAADIRCRNQKVGAEFGALVLAVLFHAGALI